MSFRPTFCRLAKKSSRQWLARQTKDPYVKKRQIDPAAFRARSAFKLLEINDQWDNFLSKSDVNAVVDLGAAPGGWSQVVAQKLGWTSESTDSSPTHDSASTFDPLAIDDDISAPVQGRGTIIAVDLLRMRPIHGVHDIVADFLAPDTDRVIQELLKREGVNDGKVDVILSDMAANASGNVTRDIECSLEICQAVMEFAERHLRTAEKIGRKRGGVVLMKHFAHPELQQFREEELVPKFNLVKYIKPDSSRAESREGFFLCMGWKGA